MLRRRNRKLLKKEEADLSGYFGTLNDDPLLGRLEADSKRIGEMEAESIIVLGTSALIGLFRQCLRYTPLRNCSDKRISDLNHKG